MASIARRTLINIFDCIRCFFFRGIETTVCVPTGLYGEHNRYFHMEVGDVILKSKNTVFQQHSAKMLHNILQSITEVQQTATMAIIATSFTSSMGGVLVKSPCPSGTAGFSMNFPAENLEHFVPDDNCVEELPSCYIIDSTPSYCSFVVKNTDCNIEPCSKDIEIGGKCNGNKNELKTCFAEEDLTTRIDITNVKLSRSRTFSENSEDNFICFIEDDQECKESSSSSRNDGYYSIQYDSDEESLCSSETSTDSDDEICTASSAKKVRFDLKPRVHVMRTWNFAYRAARKGDWENVARDRVRFQNRIQRAAEYLDKIFDPVHRQNIYENRFSSENSLPELKSLDNTHSA